jgi:hypothetical protein
MKWYNPSTYTTPNKLLFLTGFATCIFGSIACLNVTAAVLTTAATSQAPAVTLDQRIACTAVCSDLSGAYDGASLAAAPPHEALRCACLWPDDFPLDYRPAADAPPEAGL